MKDINIKGKFEENSDVSCNNMKINGKVHVNGDVNASENIYVVGKMIVDNVNSKELSVKGNITTKNIICNNLKVNGKIVARNIKSDIVKMLAGENSIINSISGKEIEIKGDIENKELQKKIVEKFLDKFSLNINNSNISKSEKCNIKNIEADFVSLKNVKVDRVICKKAEILEACEIETLIYSEIVNINNDAKVKYKKKQEAKE